MKVLFLVYHGFSEVSGISKKIRGQIKGLEKNAVSVDLAYYDIDEKGNRSWMVADKVAATLGNGWKGKFRKRFDYTALGNYVNSQHYQLIYIRSYHNANPFTTQFVKSIRRAGAKVVIEIPTYPYDQEYQDWKLKPKLFIDRLFRKQQMKAVDAVVTFSEDAEIFGQRTIQISNGIDFDTIPLRRKIFDANQNVIHLIGVAEIHYWHGFDRLVKGLAHYYQQNPETLVYFHIVGDYTGAREKEEIESVIHQYNIDEYIVRHGALYGHKLDAVFEQADFAIGSLGRHRTGIQRMRSLKNREYAARGIPFAYSESDPDFDDQPYIVRFSPDESEIDIFRILDFLKSKAISGEEIRQSIEKLSWKNQMGLFLSKLFK